MMTKALHLFCILCLSSVGQARRINARRAIVRGRDAEFGRYPYMATLVRFVPNKTRHTCGGSLIAPDVVLTAAHCGTSNITRVQIGHYNRSDDAEAFVDDLAIKAKLVHPHFDPNNSPPYSDHMLLILEGTSSKPVLRLNHEAIIPDDGQDLTLMGWGYTIPDVKGKGLTSDILQHVDTTYVNNHVCRSASIQYFDAGVNKTQTFSYSQWVTSDMMCGLEKEEGACSDDSGGPVILRGENPEEDIQVGVVSWSASLPDANISCVSDMFPGVYSRVSVHYRWVAAQVCRYSVNPPEHFQCKSHKLRNFFFS